MLHFVPQGACRAVGLVCAIEIGLVLVHGDLSRPPFQPWPRDADLVCFDTKAAQGEDDADPSPSGERRSSVQLSFPFSARLCSAGEHKRRRSLQTEGSVGNAGLSHWGLHGHGGHPEGAGNSWYTRAFDLLATGYALQGFQIGLGGAWLLPDGAFDKSKCPCSQPGVVSWCHDGTCANRGGCADVWETMEGGLGYWRNELPSPHVKWRLNNVNGCYAKEIMGAHWDFYGRPIACADMGFVTVSNRLLMAPDGLSFQRATDAGMLGQAFVRTTLGRTGPAPDMPGAFTYLLVLDASNFAGPVGYTLEEFWRDHKGYDEAPDFSHTKVKIGSTGFEFNGVQGYTSSKDGNAFLKIPQLQFPVSPAGRTEILTGVRGWGLSSLQEPLESALEGATPLTVVPMLRLADGLQPHCNDGHTSPLQMGFDSFPLLKLGADMQFNKRATGECVSEIIWHAENAVCEGGLPAGGGTCAVPAYWRPKPPDLGSACTPQDGSGTVTTAPCRCGDMQCVSPRSRCTSESCVVDAVADWSSVDCGAECAAAGYCCNDQTSSNQYLSCYQACDIRKGGVAEAACLGHCTEVATARGCSRTIGGKSYNLCGSCSDIRSDPKCTYGVGGRDACDYGCQLSSQPSSDSSSDAAEPTEIGPVTEAELPAWSTLAQRRFPEKTYASVPTLDVRPGSAARGSCHGSPGPASETLHCVRTLGGSVVGYQWYRFVDQPALQRSQLTEGQRAYLQQRVERLHELLAPEAPKNRWLEAPMEALPLADLDESLLVTPPARFERGFVPVPVYEGSDEAGCTFETKPTSTPTPSPTPTPTPTPSPTPTLPSQTLTSTTTAAVASQSSRAHLAGVALLAVAIALAVGRREALK